MKLPQDTAESEGPNLTPVIDVVFLLLIFFLVATRYDQEEKEMEVNLPEVAQAQPVSMTPQLVINITQDGTYKVVAKEYNEQELRSLIGQAKDSNPHQIALIRGDGQSALERTTRVIAFCDQVGMKHKLATLMER